MSKFMTTDIKNSKRRESAKRVESGLKRALRELAKSQAFPSLEEPSSPNEPAKDKPE